MAIITENSYLAAIRQIDAIIPSQPLRNFRSRRGRKMVPHYWTADVRRREGLDRHGELARYLRWEYGEWTVPGFLRGWVPERESSPRTRRLRFVEHLGRLRPAIKARLTVKPIVRLGQELRLLAQW